VSGSGSGSGDGDGDVEMGVFAAGAEGWSWRRGWGGEDVDDVEGRGGYDDDHDDDHEDEDNDENEYETECSSDELSSESSTYALESESGSTVSGESSEGGSTSVRIVRVSDGRKCRARTGKRTGTGEEGAVGGRGIGVGDGEEDEGVGRKKRGRMRGVLGVLDGWLDRVVERVVRFMDEGDGELLGR